MNMSKTGVSGTVYEMEDMGATKELTQAMMDTIAKVRLTVVAINSGALEATTSPPRTRYPRMNGVTVPNATHGNASGSVTPTSKVLSQEVAGAAGKTIADTAITDATTGSFDSQFMNMSKTFQSLQGSLRSLV
jgi:hypothetical protein